MKTIIRIYRGDIVGTICRKVDAAACAHGPAYARGGFEYYTKILSRNIALRNIMPGGKGKKT